MRQPLLLWLSICALWPQGLYANSTTPLLKTIWTIDHPGAVRFCYGRDTSVIYFANDQAAAKTSINRQDFGVSWNDTMDRGGIVVSNIIEITIDAEAILEDE